MDSIWNIWLFMKASYVYIFLGTSNFYFLFVALDHFLIVLNGFIIEWRDTKMRSSENA